MLILIIMMGPAVDLDVTIDPVPLPDDIEAYVRAQESQVSGIRPGTEKTIVWADTNKKTQTGVSLVYIHGFSSTRQEVAPLCDLIAKTLGANLFYTRLAGHGRDGNAMAEATVNAMLNDAVEALEVGRRLGKRVILIASSTGASLATILASLDNSYSIAALVLLSPNFGLKRPESELLLMPWASVIVRLIEGPRYSFVPSNDLQARYWTTNYPSTALVSMMGVVEIARKKRLELIKQPVLVLYSPDDQIISVDAVVENYSRFASKQKQILSIKNPGDPQHHILAGDVLSPGSTQIVYELIMQFLRLVL